VSDSWLGWAISNPLMKVMSLVLAVVTWLYVQGDEVHVGVIKAPVVWSLPAGLVSVEPLPKTITMDVRGTRAAIRFAQEKVVRVPVDLNEVGMGEHALEFGSFPASGLPPSVEVLALQPKSLRFTLDELALRKVAIKPALVGEPEPGFEVREVTFDPPVVDIQGPRTTVDALRHVSTQPLDVSRLRDDVTTEISLDLPRSVTMQAEVVPVATILVVPTMERRVLSGVQVHVWSRYDYVPEEQRVEVTLEGPTSELQGVTAEQVVAFVHLPDPAERSRYEVWYGPRGGVRVRVLHPGSAKVKVVGVQPPNISVRHR